MGKLLDWFGPSRSEIWRKLSAEIGGSYSPRTWRRRDRIQTRHAHWTITLDTYTVHAGNAHVPFTRLRAPFHNTGGFRCRIARANLFTAVGKWLGVQDVTVGAEPFDTDFVVKSNDVAAVRRFCSDPRLRQLLAQQPSVKLSVEDHEGWFGPEFPPDTDELRLVVRGHLKDTERLRTLFTLFGAALDQLCAIGAAYADEPSLKL